MEAERRGWVLPLNDLLLWGSRQHLCDDGSSDTHPTAPAPPSRPKDSDKGYQIKYKRPD